MAATERIPLLVTPAQKALFARKAKASKLTVIKMNDKVVSLAATTTAQQAKIEDLTARVIRLETALELALFARGTSAPKRLLRGSTGRP